MKKIVTIVLLLMFVLAAHSQQDPQIAHNLHNLASINPGYVGMNNEICTRVINRQQWVGFEGAPKTTIAGIESDLKLFGIKSGMGLTLIDDRQGFETKFSASLAYSQIRSLGNGKLGVGINLGIVNFDLKGTWKPPDGGTEDPLIPLTDTRKIVFDFGVGSFYKINNFYTGLSITHLNQPKIGYKQASEASFLRRHYYFLVGYKFKLLTSPIEIEPSIYLKSDAVKFQQDYNITGTYNKKFWIGVTYRNKESIVPMIGVQLINGIKLGYAYELSLSKIRKANSGSHEIMLGYNFDLYRTTSNYKYKSVRFL